MIFVASHKRICKLQNQGCTKWVYNWPGKLYMHQLLAGMISTNRSMFRFFRKKKKNWLRSTKCFDWPRKESIGSNEAVESTTNRPSQPESSSETENEKFPKWPMLLMLLFTRPLPRDGGMAGDHGVPEAEQLPRVWTRGRKEIDSRQRMSGAKNP